MLSGLRHLFEKVSPLAVRRTTTGQVVAGMQDMAEKNGGITEGNWKVRKAKERCLASYQKKIKPFLDHLVRVDPRFVLGEPAFSCPGKVMNLIVILHLKDGAHAVRIETHPDGDIKYSLRIPGHIGIGYTAPDKFFEGLGRWLHTVDPDIALKLQGRGTVAPQGPRR